MKRHNHTTPTLVYTHAWTALPIKWEGRTSKFTPKTIVRIIHPSLMGIHLMDLALTENNTKYTPRTHE